MCKIGFCCCLQIQKGGFGVKNSIRFLALALLLISVLAFGGCKFSVVSAEKLLRPPKSGVEIEDAVEKFAGESIILKNPVSATSEYSSSLTLTDLDSDGTEEAVVFYTPVSNESGVHINVLKRIGDEWISIGDFSGYGSNVETVTFRKLAKDTKCYDIVTTWSYIDNKVLTIHKVSGEGRRADLRLVSDISYTSMGYVDVDKDGFYEIFLINGDFSDKTKVPTAKIIRIEKYSMLNIGMISLSREIVGYVNSYCEEIDDEFIPMIAVYDYVNSDGLYGTDVVYWNGESSSLNLMQVDAAKNSAFSTLRSLPVYSNDIDGDTYIEIPVQEPIVGSSVNGTKNSASLTYTVWCSLVPSSNGIKLEKSSNSRLYFTDKDYFDIKSEFLSDITVTRNADADTWNIFSYNLGSLSENDILVNVRNVSQEDLNKFVSRGYKQLSSVASENKFIVYMITEEGKKFGLQDSDFVNVKL